MLISKMALKFKIDVATEQNLWRHYVKNNQNTIDQYNCNAIIIMALTFKMLSLQTKIDVVINLQTK